MIKLIEITLKVLLTPLGILEIWMRGFSAVVLWDESIFSGKSLLEKIWLHKDEKKGDE